MTERRATADLLFKGARVAVFIDGCFWHGCPQHHRAATTNADFWRCKIVDTRARDQQTTSVLRAAGWTVIRAWEHEDPADVAQRIIRAVREPSDL